ncbi:hypothetical protein GCM10007977_042330 [Dactylosporangium sucinum]|uniref:Uncharacterized protein n=1 Tax=Dactylosporangium sucinum TaxID=1424081 RepID=A0A917WVK3_9ACTN|nr:hypothetical protein GCM10007977_042330 [Dactylosporangium sucinum]
MREAPVGPVPRNHVLAGLPADEPDAGTRRAVAAGNRRRHTWLLVLDDDPTGTQCVAEVNVLLDPRDTSALRAAAATDAMTVVLTNTRARPAGDVPPLLSRLVRTAADAARSHGRDLRVLLRGDSTLRGHYRLETETVRAALAAAGTAADGVVLVPAFPQAGRLTRGDVHWVCGADTCVPVAETEFAADATFGYAESDLREWVAARGDAAGPIESVDVELIRTRPAAVVSRLRRARPGTTFVVNAVSDGDLDRFAAALQRAELDGRTYIVRCGPSFVRARAGRHEPRPETTRAGVRAMRPDGPGLVVVGSHSALTRRQVEVAAVRHGLSTVEADIDDLLGGSPGGSAERAADHLAAGRTVLLQTTRARRTAATADASLALATRVSAGLCAIVESACRHTTPGWVVAKGGITSADVATRALRATSARNVGPLTRQGVSVWQLDPASLLPDRPYVVFPGNVGDADALSHVLDLTKPLIERPPA